MTIKAFQKIVWGYYRKNRRAMPWRDSITPYRVFVSEVMLQQTQVARVMEKFPQFIKTFPSFKALAVAPLADVLAVWQGMGYNRRALYLKKSAQMVVREYSGRLPRDTRLLETLAGIGPATARSIAAFAWNSPEIFIETNIRGVFLHHFFAGRARVPDNEILSLIEKALPTPHLRRSYALRFGGAQQGYGGQARAWYYALMDYGAMLKRVTKNPSRASAHHIKQSKFAGSLRETRGKIVKILSSSVKPYTNALLMKRAAEPASKVRVALTGLMRDGLIKKEGCLFSIV